MRLDLVSLLDMLVRIDSINPSLVPGGAGEANIARALAQLLTQQGVKVELDEAAPGRTSVIATVKGRGGGRALMLNAHLDTVGVSGMTAPFTPRIEHGRMYGRGTYDMKGALAACILALLSARGVDLRGDVILTAVADEEHASLGMQSVLTRVTADAAIVAEPTGLQLCTAHKGFTWHEITTHGRAAHGSRADLGVDAISHMGRVLVALEQLNRNLQQRAAHPLLGHASLHASLIDGGQELSSYPERCTLRLERRTLPGESVTQIEAELKDLLADLGAQDPTFQAELKLTLAREPFSTPPTAEISRHLLEQAERILGRAPAKVGQGFWMDAALIAASGIPTIVFGPDGSGAHATEEWVDLDSLRACTDILTATIRVFCA
ncbi:ArgE/DapE family deacylase [Deinococcus peraridilitoris]|uniref:Probable succinyl-diaminopimelate desuccinylase n=1 Tax=Deinococcus peraridilitoris (strain DSM 19664 / LMG 22246 / CIP 109416 / KR-200) TaxID=937777 RepID=L0A8N2_DEIPD|nr:ArgE/DapE family deacylase [Deinococcus peraridilitoris]AFZ69435.1 acetylornithine deacetylase or succinyl-diaminopimelate desuccinylase [Deinococcus peraridilitoris DSM 19664]